MSTTGFKTHLKNLREALLSIPIIKKHHELVEVKTKIVIENWVIGLGAIIVLCLFTGFQAELISNVIGFLYPVYAVCIFYYVLVIPNNNTNFSTLYYRQFMPSSPKIEMMTKIGLHTGLYLQLSVWWRTSLI